MMVKIVILCVERNKAALRDHRFYLSEHKLSLLDVTKAMKDSSHGVSCLIITRKDME